MVDPKTGRYFSELSDQPLIAQLQQLTQLTSAGELISKSHTKTLHEIGYIDRFDGWSIINKKGVEYLIQLGFLAS